MEDVSKIVFSREDYNNRDALYAAIGKQIMLLMENGYCCSVRDDDIDIIIIEFLHKINIANLCLGISLCLIYLAI